MEELVESGIVSVPYIRKALRHYVQKELCAVDHIQPELHDRAYYPTRQDIRNHVHKFIVAGRLSNLDQENIAKKIEQWRTDSPLTKIFFRPCTEKEETTQTEQPKIDLENDYSLEDDEEDKDSAVTGKDFLFIHQESWQQHLLVKYGNTLSLLDATYKTTRYAIPLFFLCARTNVGYIPVAEFICQHETHTHIKEALSIIKSWNDEWYPPYFMTDYSEGEHIAIKTVFPKCEVYLCSFHREQAWERWSKDGKNGLSAQQRIDFLDNLRAVANSPDITAFEEAVKEMEKSQWFMTNTKAKNYVQNKWLNIAKRWCPVFWDKGFHSCVRTNNGVEALNRSFKMFYHQLSCDGSGSSTLEEIVHEFIPDMLHSYARTNYTYSSEYRAFSSTIPTFLQNKPRQFITHCTRRISSASEIKKDQIINLENNIFTVNNYSLTLGDDTTYPNCSCQDFQRYFMPCKHFFALFSYSGLSWDDLSPLYRNSPYTNLDVDFMSLKAAEEIVQKNLELSQANLSVKDAEEAHILVEEEKTSKHSHPTQKLGKQLREMLKQMENASFLCKDSSAMKEVLEVLVDLKTKLLQSADIESGIFLEPQKEKFGKKKNVAPLPVKRQKARSIIQRYQKRVGKKASTNISVEKSIVKPVMNVSGRCKPTKNHSITPECSERLAQLKERNNLE